MEAINVQQNTEAIKQAELTGQKLHCTIDVAPDGTMNFNWWNPMIQKLINKIAPELGKKMMKQSHLCG